MSNKYHRNRACVISDVELENWQAGTPPSCRDHSHIPINDALFYAQPPKGRPIACIVGGHPNGELCIQMLNEREIRNTDSDGFAGLQLVKLRKRRKIGRGSAKGAFTRT